MVLSEWYLEKRYKKGFADGLARAAAQGVEQGIAEGAAQAQREWEGWLRRKEAAEAKGWDFTEPHPKPKSPVERD